MASQGSMGQTVLDKRAVLLVNEGRKVGLVVDHKLADFLTQLKMPPIIAVQLVTERSASLNQRSAANLTIRTGKGSFHRLACL